MKQIKTLNLVTGKKEIVPANIYLLSLIRAEILDCERVIRDCPNIGTVLDGSRFATQKVLECLEKKMNDIANKETLFTDFYKTLLYDIESLNAICDNTENVAVRCTLIGQKMGYQIVKNFIEEINRYKDISDIQ